jgi:PadR family transcriptional regulator, regulatory protein AphA
MPTARDEGLSILGCAILQQLERGPCSGYDLKKRFASSSVHAWHAYDTQIYRELKALQSSGLVASETRQGRGGPQRRVYLPTAEGRRALIDWLQSPIELDKVKDEFRLRMWTAHLLPLESLIALLRQLGDQLDERLSDMIPIRDELRATFGPPELTTEPEAFSRQLCLDHDIAVARTRQQWVEHAIRVAELHAAAERLGRLGAEPVDAHTAGH